MLSPYRVLDVTDHRGQLAGMILASLGAEVIAVEAPGPAGPQRTAGAAAADGTSLRWWAFNRAKRSVQIDIDLSSPQFVRLLRSADVLIDVAPGGLDAARVAELHPGLVHVTVSAFGLDGPKANWPASDLTVLAAGCQLALTGDADRAPVRTAVPQAWLHAGAEAACGALLALLERARSGSGQRVDVSAQQAVMMAGVPATLFGPNGVADVGRLSGGLQAGPWVLRFVYPARDGFVSIMHSFGDTVGPYTARLMELAHERGHCDRSWLDIDWVDYGSALFRGDASAAQFEEAKTIVASLTASMTKAELFEEARRRPLLLAPVCDVAELLDSEQLAARGYWEAIDDPVFGPLRMPGAFARVLDAALPALGAAPALGADTEAVLGALDDAATPAEQPRPVEVQAGAEANLPLAGIKVLDLTWVYAGPLTTRALADFGATVVKVESTVRPDSSRAGGPFLEGGSGIDDSGGYAHFNTGKYGLNLDLRAPESAAVLEDLVRWADIVIDSYTPGVMAAWGFDHARLRAINPSVISMSTSLMGQSGPLATFSGFGNLAGAITGFYELTGWPDRAPAGPFLAYTDYISPRYMLAVLLAALDHRRRCGEGRSIDFSQAECSIHFLAPALLEFQHLDVLPTRAGNADRHLAPHGVYRSQGDDEWVAIVCESDEQWQALHRTVDTLATAGIGPDAGRAERLARTAALDEALERWTATRRAGDIEALLIDAGVPAHRVANSTACGQDTQLRFRHHYRTVDHPTRGTSVVEGPRVMLSRTPGRIERRAPTLGEHVTEVLNGMLGYDEDRIADLVIAGALA